MTCRSNQIAVILGLLLLPACPLSADSPFAIGAFGLPVLQVDGRGMGMGGVSIALSGESFSPLNPAVLTRANRSGVSGMLAPAYHYSRDNNASSTNRSLDFSYLKMVFPVPSRIVVSAGVHQVLDFDWEVNKPLEYQDALLTETFRSTGTLFRGELAIARPLFAGLRAGAGVNFYRGSISNVREMIIQGTLYDFGTAFDVRDRYSYEASGFGMNMGLLFVPHRRISAGFFYAPAFDLDLDEDFTTSPGTLSQRSLKGKMPRSWGLGFCVALRGGLLVAFDHRRADWSSFSIISDEGVEPQGLRDELEFAFGTEFTSSKRRERSWLKRSSVRAGFRLRSLPMKAGGVGVDERVATLGWGIPMGRGKGRLDLALELGSRGNLEENGLRERFFRIGVSVAAFEKWLPNERRRR